MTPINEMLDLADVVDLEEQDWKRRRNAAIVAGATARLQRPEFHGRQHQISEQVAEKIVNNAIAADCRWLAERNGVLERCLRDAEAKNSELRERVQDAEMWLDRWFISFMGTLAVLLSIVVLNIWGR